MRTCIAAGGCHHSRSPAAGQQQVLLLGRRQAGMLLLVTVLPSGTWVPAVWARIDASWLYLHHKLVASRIGKDW
jgi:hypothetical protein